MEHHFNVEIACKVGVHAAILLNHIAFWVAHNMANKTNFHNGKYWTFNSKKAFSELFPYMTERQVKYALDKLKEEDLIETGCFNKVNLDKTLWYTLTDKAIGQNCLIEQTKLSNRTDKIVQPIPDNKTTDINTDNKVAYAPFILMEEKHYQELVKLTSGDEEYVKMVIADANVWKELNAGTKKGQKKSDYLFVRKWLQRELEKRQPKTVMPNFDAVWDEVMSRLRKPWSTEGWSNPAVLASVRAIGFSKMQQCSNYDLPKMKEAFMRIYKEKLNG